MASRKEEKERRRQERLEREQAHQSKAGRARLVAYVAGGGVAVAAVVAIVVLIVSSGGGGGKKSTKQANIEPLTPPPVKVADFNLAVKKAKCSYKQYPNEGRQHLPEGSKLPKYKTNPPTSGNHYPQATSDGAFAESPNVGGLLHAMEHGRVLIQYSNDITLQQKRQLRGLFDEDPDRVLLFPNSTKMPYQVAATSWTRLLGCKQMNDATFDAIRAFVKKYRDQGPELVLQPE